ncbi:MAG: hypothetical protein RL660_1254 [Bacteroidota bacterium]
MVFAADFNQLIGIFVYYIGGLILVELPHLLELALELRNSESTYSLLSYAEAYGIMQAQASLQSNTKK